MVFSTAVHHQHVALFAGFSTATGAETNSFLQSLCQVGPSGPTADQEALIETYLASEAYLAANDSEPAGNSTNSSTPCPLCLSPADIQYVYMETRAIPPAVSYETKTGLLQNLAVERPHYLFQFPSRAPPRRV